MKSSALVTALMMGVALLGFGSTAASADPVSVQTFYQVTYGDRGRAEFDNYGENLRACDTSSDGRDVNAILTVQGIQYTVSASGAGTCGGRDLNLAENLSGRLQVCVVGLGCNGRDITT